MSKTKAASTRPHSDSKQSPKLASGAEPERKTGATLLDVSSSEPLEEPDSSRKKKLEFEGSLSRQEVVDQLKAIASGLERGMIQLQAKGQAVQLAPGHQFDLELKASSKGTKERLSLELGWRVDQGDVLEVIVDPS